MEKNRVLSQSLTHSPSLFDAPGTEAFASENRTDWLPIIWGINILDALSTQNYQLSQTSVNNQISKYLNSALNRPKNFGRLIADFLSINRRLIENGVTPYFQ